MEKISGRIIRLKDRLICNIKKPEMRVLPGQLSFFFLMTLIPLIALIGGFISLFDLPYYSISDALNSYFPNGTAKLLEVISTKVDLNFNLIIFFVSSIILASNGPHSMIIASNKIYKVDDKGYFRRRAKALLLTLVIIILLLFLLSIPLFGDTIFKFIAYFDSDSTIRNFCLLLYRYLKYPLSFAFIYYLIKIIYILSPDKKIERKNVTYGAIFTSVSWVLITQLYSWYVENFSNYSTFYGGISSILILMTWLYFISYIFVLGMALNETKYELSSNLEIEEKNKDEKKGI